MAIDFKARALKAAATRRKNKKINSVSTCLCGCGEIAKGRFLQGHDAKLHSQVVEAVREQKKLPAEVRRLAEKYVRTRWPSEAREVL